MTLKVPVSGAGSRAGSASSGVRVADRWYYDSSPAILDQSEPFPYLILDTKLRPGTGRHREASTPVPGLKREPSEEDCASSGIVKSRRVTQDPTHWPRRTDQADVSSIGSQEKSAEASVSMNLRDSRVTPITKARDNKTPSPETESAMGHLKLQNRLLQREIDLLITYRNQKIICLQENVMRLEESNKKLNAMLCHYSEAKEVGTHEPRELTDEVQELRAKLNQKDEQLEGRMNRIFTLDEQLSTHEWLTKTKENLQFDFTCFSSFSNGLAELEQQTRGVASFLAQCLSSHAVSRIRKNPREAIPLHKFIKDKLGTMGFLVSNQILAMRALTFAFVRDRVFFSQCWTALHSQGYILQELQQLIQRTTPPGTLESFHRASLESMLNNDHHFEHCWIRKEVEDVQNQFLALFHPLFHPSEFEKIQDQIKKDLRMLFTDAFKVRARFIPPRGSRYKLLHLKPGVADDPSYMKVGGTSSNPIFVPSDGKVYRIKACIHGCLVEHPISEDSSHAAIPQTLNRPLIGDDESLC